MLSKQCIKLSSTALLLFAVLIMGGCTTSLYRATPEDTRNLSIAQARKLLFKSAQTIGYLGGTSGGMFCTPGTGRFTVTNRKMEAACPSSSLDKPEGRSFRFADYPALVAILEDDDVWIGSTACINDSGSTSRSRGTCTFRWFGPTALSTARDFVRAWYVLARAGGADPTQEAAFEQAAQGYRNATVKPQLPEEAVRYKVQAELAVQQKRFDDAVDLYDEALGIAPWWAPGHYNRGLILGELQDYQGGIRALQKYLKLEPDAPNARTVQLKIYQWESLVPRVAK